MGRLDELLSYGSEDYRTLTVKTPISVAEDLKVKAKKLGISRTKLVQEIFGHGLDEFNKKFNPSGTEEDGD